MELVLAQLQEEGSECGVAPGVAHFLADSFKTNCGAVLKLSAESHVSDDEVQRLHWWDSPLYLFICLSIYLFSSFTYYPSALH